MKTKTEIIPVIRGERPQYRQRKHLSFRGHKRRRSNVNISSEQTTFERVNCRRLTHREQLNTRVVGVPLGWTCTQLGYRRQLKTFKKLCTKMVLGTAKQKIQNNWTNKVPLD